MRVWDISPIRLCRKHLLGEHREIHAIFSIIYYGKKGYSHHPETLRWVGKLKALRKRHEATVKEMLRRGYKHHSPLPRVNDYGEQYEYVNSIYEQFEILMTKECECPRFL